MGKERTDCASVADKKLIFQGLLAAQGSISCREGVNNRSKSTLVLPIHGSGIQSPSAAQPLAVR
jgi:hypothetical protein